MPRNDPPDYTEFDSDTITGSGPRPERESGAFRGLLFAIPLSAPVWVLFLVGLWVATR